MKQVKEMGIVAVCLMLLGFGICMGIGTYLMYRNGEEEYDTLREYVAVEELKENADGETPEKNQKELSVRMENTSSFLMEMEQRRYLPTRQTESKQHRIP